MGNKKTFRDGTYYRHVWFGKRTVKQGECAAVWTPSGRRKVIEGPQRVRLFFSHVRFLTRYVADGHEYLLIQYRDGHKESQRGPAAEFLDPCVHVSINVMPAHKLAANEALIVYRESPEAANSDDSSATIKQGDTIKSNGNAAAAAKPVRAVVGTLASVSRRVVRGPAIYVPTHEEWIHSFSWHGYTNKNSAHDSGTPRLLQGAADKADNEMVPHGLKFSKLRCMPDQMYVTVRDVRTKDDAQLRVHLMIFHEIRDIELMLDATNDPIGDFINAATADVMSFGAANTYESLLAHTEQLSDVATFPTVRARMQACGYTLRKVVYRGYSTSAKLQAMHDEAIAKRTALRLQSATASVEQEEQSHTLKCKEERSQAEQQLEEADARHRMALRSLEAEQGREARDADHRLAMRHEKERAEAQQQLRQAANDEEVRRATALKALGVDLTKLLCVSSDRAPDQHVRIDSATPTALHLEMRK